MDMLREIAMARREMLTTMLDRATITRPVRTRDETGSWIETMETVAENIPCGMDWDIKDRERVEIYQVDSKPVYKIRFPVDTTILDDDKIIIDGDTYEVVSNLKVHAFSLHKNILAAEVT